MEHFLHLVDWALVALVEVEIIHQDHPGVIRMTQDENDENYILVKTDTETFRVRPESGEALFREHLLPVKGWGITPYTRRTLREATARMEKAWKELVER